MNSLPRTSKNELLYSSSANDDMVCPLFEKAFVDLYFDGDYFSSQIVAPSTVLTSFTNGYFEKFRNFAFDSAIDINAVIDHGLKTNSPMLVGFRKKSGILQEFHCYTLVGIQNDMVKVYNPYGSYIYLTESDFHESLETYLT